MKPYDFINHSPNAVILTCILLLLQVSTGYGQQQTALKSAYEGAFLMGTTVNEAIVSGADKASQEIVIREFNTITAENCMKTESVNPHPGVYTFDAADNYLAFGQEHNTLEDPKISVCLWIPCKIPGDAL